MKDLEIERCRSCGCPSHCGISCPDCWECPDCECKYCDHWKLEDLKGTNNEN